MEKQIDIGRNMEPEGKSERKSQRMAERQSLSEKEVSSADLERLTHELFRRLYLKNRGSNQTQGKVLKILYKKGRLSQKEVQEILDVKPGSISEIITKLEKRELVMRVQDPEDRRRVLLELTEKGRQDVEEFSRNYQNSVMQFFEVLEDDEKQEFGRILVKLLDQESDKKGADEKRSTGEKRDADEKRNADKKRK